MSEARANHLVEERIGSYSHGLRFVVVVAARLRQFQENGADFGLHVGLTDEALLQ